MLLVLKLNILGIRQNKCELFSLHSALSLDDATPSLPRALITPKLGYPLISINSNRESLGNPRESPKWKRNTIILM